jgi:hypothetical protein
MSSILISHFLSDSKEGGLFQSINGRHHSLSTRTFSVDNWSSDSQELSGANEIDNLHETAGLI